MAREWGAGICGAGPPSLQYLCFDQSAKWEMLQTKGGRFVSDFHTLAATTNSPVFCPARLYFFLINTTTIATMNKHCDYVKNKTTEKMSRLCWTTLLPRPLLNCLWTHTPLHVIFPIACK